MQTLRMRALAICGIAGALALGFLSHAFAQSVWDTPDGKESVGSTVQYCLNSSGKAVPTFNAAGAWQCAGGGDLYNAVVNGAGSSPSNPAYMTGAVQGLGSAVTIAGTGIVNRPNNTATYTAGRAWANATAGATYGTFAAACSANQGNVIISDIMITDSANQTLKLTGELHIFNAVPGTPQNDNDVASWALAAGDLSNQVATVSFSLNNVENSGAGNLGSMSAHIAGLNITAQCPSGSTNLYYQVRVTNAYVPVANEALTFKIKATQVSVGFATAATGSLTRASGSLTYNVNSAWAPGSGTLYGTLTNFCRAPGSTGKLTDLEMQTTGAGVAPKLQAKMHIFDTPPANPLADNAAWALSATDLGHEIGVVPFTMTYLENAAGGQSVHVQNAGSQFTCGATANLYYMIEVINAYAAASQEVLTPIAKSLFVN